MRKLLVLLAITALFSCKRSAVLFDEPQPVDVKEQQQFSRRIIGSYESLKDSTVLVISKDLILRSGYYENGMKISKIDSTEILKGDTLTDVATNEKVFVTRVGDSIAWTQKYTDTIFSKARHDVLKKYKGYYFISKYYKNEGWEVQKIKLKKGLLSISDISAEDDIAKLEMITETKFDTIAPRKMGLTKKQFRQFIKQNGFGDEEVFMKK